MLAGRIAGVRPRLGVPENSFETSMMSSTFTLSRFLHKFPRDALRQRFSELEHPAGDRPLAFHRRPARRINNARSLSITTPPRPPGAVRVFRFDVIVFCPLPSGTLRVI